MARSPTRPALHAHRRRAAAACAAALALLALAPRAVAQPVDAPAPDASAPAEPAVPITAAAPVAPWSGRELPPVRVTAASGAGAGDAPEFATLPDRLAAVLRYHGSIERTGRFVAGGTVLGTGVLSGVGGVLVLTNSSLAPGLTGQVLGWTLVIAAPLYAVLGAVLAFVPGTYERFAAEFERDLRAARSRGDAAVRALIRWQAEADRQRNAQRTSAVTGFVVGAIAIGFGGFLLAAPPALSPAFNAGFGTVFLLFGALDIGAAVGSLLYDSPAQQLLRTFRIAAGLERVAPAPLPPAPPRVSLGPLPGGGALAGLAWQMP